MTEKLQRAVIMIGAAVLIVFLLWFGFTVTFLSRDTLTDGALYGVGLALVIGALLTIAPKPTPRQIEHSELTAVEPPRATNWAATVTMIAIAAYCFGRAADVITQPWLLWAAGAACLLAAGFVFYAVFVKRPEQKTP